MAVLVRLRSLLLAAGAAACFLAPLAQADTAWADTAAAVDPAARVIELTNVERQKAGLAPLAPNPSLAQAAASYTALMSATGCFSHSCGPVPEFSERAQQAGYTGWNALAENIAAGQRTPEAVVQAWMNSAGHRENILNPKYTEIGVGMTPGGKMGIYWAQEFGARRYTGTEGATISAPAPPPAPAAGPQVALPRGANGCAFVLGLATLRAMVGSAGGDCVENERFNPANGNVEQQTSGGMFVWRKADNWTAFTDGYRTWLNGPQGLQVRLNVQRFAWERDSL